jgi:hypothetical protein
MDGLRKSTRISKLDRKTNEYIRGKMDAHNTILNDITSDRYILRRSGRISKLDKME